MFSDTDHSMMHAALALAGRGMYTTHPNPRVGCVIGRGSTIVGRGFHARAGGPHAEIAALADAGDEARGATAYVTLEPCCHTGRTGPCTSALIEAAVSRVVFAHEDPNPVVAGKGAQRLLAAGIDVQHGLLSEEARALNPGYLQRVQKGRPYIRSKIAISLDGRTALADGTSKWITGSEARADVQHWRGRSSAILTGIGTVLSDDPGLDLRLELPGVQPLQPARVVLDSALRLPVGAKLFLRGGPVHVITTGKGLRRGEAIVHRVRGGEDGLDLPSVMVTLAALEFNEVLVEAGATLNGALLQAGLVDELLIYVAPDLLGDSARGLARIAALASMDERIKFEFVEVVPFGRDLRLTLRPSGPRGGV